MVAFNFNANAVEPSFGSTHKQLPPGKKYKGVIVDSAAEPTKGGNGNMLVLTVKCVDGPQANNEMMLRLNLQNVSAQAVEIANKQLSALCHVLGQYQLAATEQLHNIPFLFDVDWQKGNEPTTEKPDGGYTEIKALYDVNGNAPGKAGTGQRVAAAPAAPAPAIPPAGVVATTAAPWQQAAPGAAANGGWGQK